VAVLHEKSRSFSCKAVLRSLALQVGPNLPFLPTPPLNTGLMKIGLWRSISPWISSSDALGPSTSVAGKSTCSRSFEP
jgi:hypothetical protein